MAVIGIRYEGKNDTLKYKSVYLTRRTHEVLIFDSGDFVRDWWKAKQKYVNIAYDELYLLQSSSVDNFIMDGAPYDTAWLVYGKDVEIPRLVYEEEDGGWEMFVPKGEKLTWEELKAYAKESKILK